MTQGRANEYVYITLKGKPVAEHRYVWFLNTGKWPDKQIDHIDGNKKNNDFSNLRLATNSENQRNQSIRKNNTSGIKCVSRCRGSWRVRVRHDHGRFEKCFKDLELAELVAHEAIIKFHGDFANANTQKRGFVPVG